MDKQLEELTARIEQLEARQEKFEFKVRDTLIAPNGILDLIKDGSNMQRETSKFQRESNKSLMELIKGLIKAMDVQQMVNNAQGEHNAVSLGSSRLLLMFLMDYYKEKNEIPEDIQEEIDNISNRIKKLYP